uniref:CCHC-type domain-containing protein n=1 Tax=Tanacetum cinerariifolium TaxID=118510 RepID=A0A6L2P022_TANCI|nr:hypothetical protein [Tanacetum cinerariifolium]
MTTTTTSVTDAQLKALIDQGVARALTARDADRNTNADDNHVSRTDMKKKMTDKYCPRGEMKKLGSELCNLRVKSNDVVSYSQRFQELALLCVRMFPEEADKIEIYVGGLPDVIYRSVVASRPKTMQEAIEMVNELMDKRNNTWTERQTKNKRKQDDNNNQAQQQPLKKQGVAIAYTIGPGERKVYARTLPLCNKCKLHHNGQCTVKCVKRVGHLTRDCRSPATTNNHRNPTCYECRNQGHYRSDCPELKNQDHGNQAGGTGAYGMVQALEGGETNQDLNDVKDDTNP